MPEPTEPQPTMPESPADRPETPGFAGVLAFRDGQVALVLEHYETWDRARWNTPSGAIEQGESAEAAAIRELREETGLVVSVEQLTLIAEAVMVGPDGTVLNKAWNFRAEVPSGEFAADDPDGSVQEVRWFPVAEAIKELEQLPYPPIAEPAIACLRSTDRSRWTFTLGADGRWSW